MGRKAFLRTALACTGRLTLGRLSAPESCDRQNQRPNIVLIMADDMGFSDIGCYGGEIDTPNLDALAKGGMRFSQFYNYASCCPTRASLMTGLHLHQSGTGQMAKGSPNSNQFISNLDSEAYQGYLNRNCVTMAEALREADYQTFMRRKWHLGDEKSHWPTRRGFEKYFSLIQGVSNYFDPGSDKDLVYHEDPFEIPEDFYTTDCFSKYLSEFIRRTDRNRPFFLYTAHNAPHWPFHAWQVDIKKYQGYYLKGWGKLRRKRYEKQKELGIFKNMDTLSPRNEEADPWTDIENKEGNRTVRDGKWKLVSYSSEGRQFGVGRGKRTGEWQLYNLKTDRTGLSNVLEEYPERAEKMIAHYENFADRVGVIDWETVSRKTGRL